MRGSVKVFLISHWFTCGIYCLLLIYLINRHLFAQNVINGLQLGFVYALIALGYTMVYGIVKLINFAHGDVFMVGAFVSYFCRRKIWPASMAVKSISTVLILSCQQQLER